MKGLLKYYGINKVFILGAGFSRPAGLPLTSELLREIHDVSGVKPWHIGNGKMAKWGQADWLVDELKHYYPTSRISHKRILENKVKIDVEEFLSYVAASSAFIENTSEKFDEHGSHFQSFAKCWLAEVIYNYQELIKPENQLLYDRFAKNLNNSLVLTFNWDTILESTLKKLRIPFSYDFNSAMESKQLPFIKMHGSIDWFRPRDYNYQKLGTKKFEKISELINDMYRYNGNIRDCFSNYMTPFIVTPNFDKLNQLRTFGDLWSTPWIYLQDELEIIIIGFSMREDDFHTRAFIYPQLYHGAKNNHINIKVIDFASDQKQQNSIKRKFKGIRNIEFSFDGFNEETLNWLV
ncbi:MAG: hypothetical protein RIF33_14215 [Cyclobacteriaceae bacterium]